MQPFLNYERDDLKRIKWMKSKGFWHEMFYSFVAVFIPFEAYAYSNEFCPPHDTEVIIDNRVTPDRLLYDYSKSISEITAKSGKSGVLVAGLFSSKVVLQRRPEIEPDRNNGCPIRIMITVVIDFDPTIYVAREFMEGTDAYNYVQWHENEHARITIENNRRYLPYLEQELRRYIDGLRIRYPNSFEDAAKSSIYILSKINYIVEREWRNLNNFINKSNDDFDLKERKHSNWVREEYEKVKER